jgi:ribonuclease HII
MGILFPKFNLEQNKGYGTANHLNSLMTYGTSIIHRTSFVPKKLKAEINNAKQQRLT